MALFLDPQDPNTTVLQNEPFSTKSAKSGGSQDPGKSGPGPPRISRARAPGAAPGGAQNGLQNPPFLTPFSRPFWRVLRPPFWTPHLRVIHTSYPPSSSLMINDDTSLSGYRSSSSLSSSSLSSLAIESEHQRLLLSTCISVSMTMH